MADIENEKPPSLLLAPTTDLRDWLSEDAQGLAFSEYRLVASPQTLQSFDGLFVNENGSVNENLFVWTTPHSFVGRALHSPRIQDTIPGLFLQLQVMFALENSGDFCAFPIYSRTLKDALPCFRFLLDLHDDKFILVSFWGRQEPSGGPCPLSADDLIQALPPVVEHLFLLRSMSLSPDQCETLLSSTKRLGFVDCSFTDGGEAFNTTFQEKEIYHAVTQELHIAMNNPFNRTNWLRFLENLRDELTTVKILRVAGLEFGATGCAALATVSVERIEIDSCRFVDHGSALIDCVSTGLGPKGICFQNLPMRRPFESIDQWLKFMNALESNQCRLKRISFDEVGLEDVIWRAFAKALRKNKRLVHLSLHHITTILSCWDEVVSSLSDHPTLQSIEFRSIAFVDVSMQATRVHRTQTIARLLSTNHRITSIAFSDDLYCRKVWAKTVAPRLEYNPYHDKFIKIQEIEQDRCRAAVLGKALACLRGNASLQWSLLSRNEGLVSSYLNLR